MKDAEWLAKLLRCGLIESNFVQPEDILIHHRTSEQNRIHKILKDANIKLTSVLSDIFGVSGRRILEAILNGEKIETDGLRKMVDWRTKASINDIASAINGPIRSHHRDMLRYHWEHMSYLEKAIEELEKQIDQLLSPYRKEVELLDGIPGVKSCRSYFYCRNGR